MGQEQIDILDKEVDKLRERSHLHTTTIATLDLKIGQLSDTMIALAKLDERVNIWMGTTDEYRKTLCNKIDRLFGLVGDLPCKARAEITKGNVLTMRLMWAAVGILAGLLFFHLGWK